MSGAQKIAAFFDLDGTLLPGASLEWRFIGYLLGRNAITSGHVRRWLAQFCGSFFRDPRAATLGNKIYLAGLQESLVADWKAAGAPDALPFYAEGIECISQHFARRHEVILLSGTLSPLARMVAGQFPGPVEVRATELEALDGRWTGRVAGEHMSGAAKARAMQSIASRWSLDLRQCYAYGNELADLPMLMSVGRPVAVNPSIWLAQCARRLGWQICDWVRARGLSPAEATRVLASKAGQ